MLHQFPQPSKLYNTQGILLPLEGISPGGCQYIVPILREMVRRSSENTLDKICGLGYILGLKHMPTFSRSEDPEIAWQHLIRHLDHKLKLELLIQFPYPGAGSTWAPTWSQVVKCPPLLSGLESPWVEYVPPRMPSKKCRRFPVATWGYLTGVELSQGPSPGIFNVKYKNFLHIKIEVQIMVSDKDMSIPNGEYTILTVFCPMVTNQGVLCSVSPVACGTHNIALQKVAGVKALSNRWLNFYSSRQIGHQCCFT